MLRSFVPISTTTIIALCGTTLTNLETPNDMFTGDTGLYDKANGFLYMYFNSFRLMVSALVSMEGYLRKLGPSVSRGLELIGTELCLSR